MDAKIIKRLEQSGATIFRINLSHTNLSDLPSTIEKIQAATAKPICIDTEGAQVRTGNFQNGPLTLRHNSLVRVCRKTVLGNEKQFNFYPIDIVEQLQVGDLISIDFNSVLVQIINQETDALVMRVLNGGVVGQNKAVTVERPIRLSPLTAKDRSAISIGRNMGLTHFALSFANRGEDVDLIRSLTGKSAFIISKIESTSALDNLDDIGLRSNALLIDRGDLSREVPIELIPQTQKKILKRGRELDTPVYVATNLLESMVLTPTPTRAEVNDIYNTLLDGADGLVLAAETAIGNYPIQCASMVNRLIRGYENTPERENGFKIDPISQLTEPHGGVLVNRVTTTAEEGIEKLPSILLSHDALMDVEQLAIGVYSPLTGFMDKKTVASVLHTHSLLDNTIWTLPITLQIGKEEANKLSVGDRIALRGNDGEIYATLDLVDNFMLDLEKYCNVLYGTKSPDHPGVRRTMEGGPHFLGGEITQLKPLNSSFRHYQLSPIQSRFLFDRMGWSQVVGFHGRNPAHRAHELIQMAALEQTGADGLFINPAVGPKKSGDFLPWPILKSYQIMLEQGVYPPGKAVLGSFATYSRYCGPREAVFTALCRKNMGCSHFIVGRDHTGVGNFYPKNANRKYFEELENLGIKPVFFDAVGYNPGTGKLELSNDGGSKSITGTEVRETLRAGNRLPEWFMRNTVQDALLEEISSGRPVFHD